MENTRSRGRKRYCCCYCNVYFYQVDSWQRHNRKHTGVEIECDDCGEMCSDNFDLKSHQQLCEAYHVYSEELYTEPTTDNLQSLNRSKTTINNKTTGNEDIHETPDSTSKQESIHENEDLSDLPRRINNSRESPTSWRALTSRTEEGDSSPNIVNAELNDDNTKNSELDDLIGEDKEASRAIEAQEENEDPETEALIGVDQSEVEHLKPNTTEISKLIDTSVGVDSQIVIKVESALNDAKRGYQKIEDRDTRNLESTFISRPSPSSSTVESMQTMSLENSELNKKYQPYFCKNCGARFTRKDSVTRHLKKGTCSGKSAIVCNICGKVFPEMFELQEHFKLDHKNVLLTPTIVTHRSILPKPDPHDQQQQHFSSYPSPFVLREQHLPPGSRPYAQAPDPPYRSIPPPGIQNMFYTPGSNQNSYRNHSNYPQPSPNSHYRDPPYGNRQFDLKYSPGGMVSKEGKLLENSNNMMMDRNDKHKRKRDYLDYHVREQFHKREETNAMVKRGKLDNMEYNDKIPAVMPYTMYEKHNDQKNQINLSEYTNNAMNSQQYFTKRFVQKEQSEKDEPGRIHQCKVCGNEFPRFEYLLTHLRKHKEKPENEHGDDENTQKYQQDVQNKSNDEQNSQFPVQQVPSSINDSTSSDDSNDNQKRQSNYAITQSGERPAPNYSSTNEPVTILQQPQGRYNVHQPTNESAYVKQPHAEQLPNYSPQIQQHNQAGVVNEGTLEAITPGIDGKFRPFICENCGQRFTRKDSLVRHAKKQTCFEEQTELKCRHCDKTFRYHKCLIQHQELVHGISREEQSKQISQHSDEEDTDSDDKSEKNYQDDKKNNTSNHVSESNYLIEPNPSILQRDMVEISSKQNHPNYHISPQHQTSQSPHHQHKYRPISFPGQYIPHDQQRQIQSMQTPKLIPPKPEEKFRIQPPQPPPPPQSLPQQQQKPHQHPPPLQATPSEGGPGTNQQDSQYIGYCTVPRPFQCEYCGDRFAHRHSLKRHVRRHLGIGIPCHDCGKLYRDQSEWRRHQRSIHNRHYEKYEVPSRISFRDGVEHGLIGVVPNSEFSADHEDGSDTDGDKSEDELSMVKNQLNYDNQAEQRPPSSEESYQDGNHESINSSSHETITTTTTNTTTTTIVSKEERMSDDKDEKVKPFNFKAYSSGDKDSRKSALDRYLRSPQSDEEEMAEKNNNNNNDIPVETHI